MDQNGLIHQKHGWILILCHFIDKLLQNINAKKYLSNQIKTFKKSLIRGTFKIKIYKNSPFIGFS